ncbi:MAG: DUF4831 family protein, partial [Paludibacteraceae bacterium]|nr:DUF4831 family protein [Paludibacteraceae bacterium]
MHSVFRPFLLAGAMLMIYGTARMQAQNIVQGEATQVYFLPKNTLRFDVRIAKVTETAGIFYQYAERYLGTKQVITENKTYYQLRAIDIKTNALPDSTKAFQLTPTADCLIQTDRHGILRSVNAPTSPSQKSGHADHRQHTPRPSLLPLGEEQMMSGSIAKMAESTAKQIYRIREARLNLLSGDMDNMPADGESLQTMLKGLDRQERQLCELFIGTRQVEERTEHIVIDPTEDVTRQILFRFSTHDGVVDADDLSGSPCYWSMHISRVGYDSAAKPKSTKSRLYYNMPGTARVSVAADNLPVIEREVALAQYGIIIPLPDKLINDGVRIMYDTKTGAIRQMT